MQIISVKPLGKAQSLAAYPLIREVIPGLDLAGWRHFARRNADPRHAARRGIMAAYRAGRPYPLGLFSYRTETDLQHGALLTAEHFIAVDVLNQEPVLVALVAALDELALRLACRVIRSVLHGGAAGVAPSLLAAGHHLEGTMLYKTLTPPE